MLFELMRQRRIARLTQRELAALAEVHPETVSRLERGAYKGGPEAETLRRLAAALGKPAGDLFPELLGSAAQPPARPDGHPVPAASADETAA